MSCLTQLLFGCGSLGCQLCFAPCGTSKHARALNASILVVSCIVAGALASPAVAHWMQRQIDIDAPGMARVAGALSVCTDWNSTLPANTTATVTAECINAWARAGASRIMWANTVFFALMLLLTLGVSSSSDCRFGFHAGSWGVKIVTIALLCVASFAVSPTFFTEKWHWVESVGGAVFSALQVIMLVRAVHVVALRLAASRETVSASAVAQIAFSGMAYAFCYVAAAFQYRHVMHTQTGTAESGHKGLQHAAAINNMVLIAVITVVSLLPVVRHKTPYSGTIQSSVISLQITVISYIATGTVVDTLVAIASLILEFGVLYHICTRSRTKSPLLMVQDDVEDADDGHSGGYAAMRKSDGQPLGYSCTFFYLFLATASMQFSSTLALAANASEPSRTAWISIASALAVASIYVWSLIYPTLSR